MHHAVCDKRLIINKYLVNLISPKGPDTKIKLDNKS